jgi:hypothetical protein
MTTKLVIIMEGGLVQSIVANGPVEIALLNTDTGGMDAGDLTRIDGQNTQVSLWNEQIGNLEVNPPKLADLFAQINRRSR